MKIVGSSESTIVSIIMLTILTFGGYLIYKSITAKDDNSDVELELQPVEPKSSDNHSVLAANLQSEREANTTEQDLKSTPDRNITRYNPSCKGVWKDSTGKVRDKFTGKLYAKDASLEILSKDEMNFHYNVKYKGDICWFPVSLISAESHNSVAL